MDGQAGDNGHPMRGEVRTLLSGINLVVLIVSIGAGCWAVINSFTDAGGDNIFGVLIFGAPALYAGWCMLAISWQKLDSLAPVLQRVFSASLIAPAFVVVPVGVFQLIAVALPGVRDVIAAAQAQNRGSHYYWDEGLAPLYLVPLAGYVISAAITIGVALIITLPVLSIRLPRMLGQGSHVEKVEGGKQPSTVAFVFVGLGAFVLGIALCMFSNDNYGIADVPSNITRFFDALSGGYFDRENAVWLLGALLVAAGVVLLGWGCLRVLFARASR